MGWQSSQGLQRKMGAESGGGVVETGVMEQKEGEWGRGEGVRRKNM